MKKFTLLIASLFFTIGAMAQFGAGTEYRIKEKSTGKYWSVGGTAANAYGEVYGAGKIEDDAKQIFTFEVANEGTYYVKSNSGEYISYQGTGAGWNVNADPSITNAHELTFEETANIGEYKIKGYNTSKGANKYFKWEYVGASGKYHPFNDADAGATFIVEKANAEVFTIVYNYTYNDEVVKSVTHEVVEGTGYPSTDLGLFGVIVDDSTKPEGAVSADGEYTFSVTFNMPFEYADSYEKIDTWYYAVINSTNHNVETGALGDGKYMRAGTSDIPADTQTFGLSAVDTYSWGFVGDPINGFKMVSKGGMAIKTNNQASTKAELVEIAQGTVFTVKNPENAVPNRPDAFCLLNTNNYLNLQSGYVKQWTGADRGSTILLTQRNFDVTISDLGYATLFLDRKVYIPEGVEAYVVKSDNALEKDGYIQFTLVTGILPKNTGVVLKNAGTYEFTTSVENATADVANNMLTGTVVDAEIAKEAGNSYYILANVDNVVGFYGAKYGEDETKFKNYANKAYLVIPADQSQGAAFYGFDWGGTTGIEQITDNREQSTVIYDLTGRRIEAITAPGIYVVNGKKVLVK